MITFQIAAPSAAAFAAMQALLDRRRELRTLDQRLVDERTAAEAELSRFRKQLDAVEAEIAVADVAGDDRAARKHTAASAETRNQIGIAQLTIERKERARRGLAPQERAIAEEIEAAMVGFRSAFHNLREDALAGLTAELQRNLHGEGALIDSLRFAHMLRDSIGVPAPSWFHWTLVPSPLAGVSETPSGRAGDFVPAYRLVSTVWLLNGGDGGTEGTTVTNWQEDPQLAAQAARLKPYAAANAEAATIIRHLQDQRGRELVAEQARRREEPGKRPSVTYSGFTRPATPRGL